MGPSTDSIGSSFLCAVPWTAGSPGPFPSGLPGHRIMHEAAGTLESTRHPPQTFRASTVPPFSFWRDGERSGLSRHTR